MGELEFKVSIDGIDKLNRLFEEIGSTLSPEKIEPVLLQAAALVALAIRREAPYTPKTYKHRNATHIRDSVVVKQTRARAGFPAPAIAAVDRKKTPHASIVERGTKMRQHKSGKSTGKMPRNRFFKRAVDSTADTAADYVIDTLGDKLEGALR